MGDNSELPVDNDGWFKRHIIEALNDLKRSHETVINNQKTMHAANVNRMDGISRTLTEHEDEDLQKFSALNQAVSDLQPVKRLVYGAIALVLMAFMGVLIGIVITKH